jgi:Na+-transporting NADH:ubiquinone oxidoreductase subunit A
LHKIKKGLDLPMAGRPEQAVDAAAPCSRVALVAADYPGLKASFAVHPGDAVLRGQVLFQDRKLPDLRYTAPAAGKVLAIHRGDKRVLVSAVIELSEAERAGDAASEQVAFDSYTGAPVEQLPGDAIRGLLLESGLWTALRTRPFSRVPDPASAPSSIFITAIDTHPLAPDVGAALAGREDDFAAGTRAVARLADGPTFLCTGPGSPFATLASERIRHEVFDGPHPAGTVGVHINTLDPVFRGKVVWHVGYQDVAAIGALLRTGRIDSTRVVALSGPGAARPRLLRTRVGAALEDITAGELLPGDNRVISGSVLGGRTAMGGEHGYLGRYHHQVTALREGNERELFGWLSPGSDKFSVTNAFVSAFARARRFAFTTTTNGSTRPMVPIGTYEDVMPMDIPPTFILRALITGDTERAEELGVLELDEEDLALATFVCPGKYEYGPMLRRMLEQIQREA